MNNVTTTTAINPALACLTFCADCMAFSCMPIANPIKKLMEGRTLSYAFADGTIALVNAESCMENFKKLPIRFLADFNNADECDWDGGQSSEVAQIIMFGRAIFC